MIKITPPFTEKTAKAKVQTAENAWNSKNAEKVSMAYTIDSNWRNRDKFLIGRKEIKNFLSDKWNVELYYKLRKYLWSYTDNRISVRFEYECSIIKQDSGLEHTEMNNGNLMTKD